MKTKTITIPAEIYDDFLNLLDVAQSSISDEMKLKCSPKERKTLKFVRKLLGNKASQPTTDGIYSERD
jgi:predicted CopG family antitoxin